MNFTIRRIADIRRAADPGYPRITDSTFVPKSGRNLGKIWAKSGRNLSEIIPRIFQLKNAQIAPKFRKNFPFFFCKFFSQNCSQNSPGGGGVKGVLK